MMKMSDTWQAVYAVIAILYTLLAVIFMIALKPDYAIACGVIALCFGEL